MPFSFFVTPYPRLISMPTADRKTRKDGNDQSGCRAEDSPEVEGGGESKGGGGGGVEAPEGTEACFMSG